MTLLYTPIKILTKITKFQLNYHTKNCWKNELYINETSNQKKVNNIERLIWISMFYKEYDFHLIMWRLPSGAPSKIHEYYYIGTNIDDWKFSDDILFSISRIMH